MTSGRLGDDGTGDAPWRVELFRALVRGDLALAATALEAHVDALSGPFPATMPTWKLQWEARHWWMLRDATPLFLASAFAHPRIVAWLLAHGADRMARSHLGRTPLEVLGDCGDLDDDPGGAPLAARVAACRVLLEAPPAVPAPPTANVVLASHVASQVVILKAGAAQPQQQQQQVVYKCVVELAWDTPLSNGALIEQYEVRHRLLVEEEEAQEQDDEANDDGDGPSATRRTTMTTATAPTTGGAWRVERTRHNRKTRRQGLVLEGLQFDGLYEFALRSWNAAGKGEWGPPHRHRTLASPEAPTV